MKIKYLMRTVLVASLAGLFGCGGGGSKSETPPPPAKATTTISGSVQFPALSSLVAKQAAVFVNSTTAAATSVTVRAYNLDGTFASDPVPAVKLSGVGQYSYSLPGLDTAKDYVIKATRGQQILKKLIEKADVVEGAVVSQNVTDSTTAAVVVASQKLSQAVDNTGVTKITLGDPLPVLPNNQTVADISKSIVLDVAPKALEAAIDSAATIANAAISSGDVTSLTQAVAELYNMLKIVQAAVVQNTDTSLLTKSGPAPEISLPPSVTLFTVTPPSGGGTPAVITAQKTETTSTVSSTQLTQTVTSSATVYVPPKVKIDIVSDSSDIYGITLDVVIPADVQVRVDATGKLDMAQVTAPAGASIDAQYKATTRTVRLVIAGASPLPLGLVTLRCDRTAGKVVTAADFTQTVIKASDLNGSPLASSFTTTLTATSTGS